MINRGKIDQEYPLFMLYNKSNIPGRPASISIHAASSSDILGRPQNLNKYNKVLKSLTEGCISLQKSKCKFIVIPCNTAHAPAIQDVFLEKLKQSGSDLKVLDMITETANFLQKECANVKTVGVLSTLGTWKVGFYPGLLGSFGYEVRTLSEDRQQRVHNEALYHPEYGIKVQAHPVTTKARNVLMDGFESLEKKGAQAIILGCTEIPLGLPERKIGETFCIDTSLILARALIREFSPDKLIPWSWGTS